MAKRFHLRYVNEIAGAFVLAALALLVAGVVLAGRAQRWFEPTRELTVLMPSDGSLGLRRGADVLLLGTTAGSVEQIFVDDDGRMKARVSIRRDFARFVRADSEALVRRRFEVAGDAMLEITRGTGAELPEQGATISVRAAGPDDPLADALAQIRDEAVPAVREFRTAAQEFSKVASSLGDPQGPLQQALGHANQIAAGVERGEGLAGKLLTDAEMAREVETILDDLAESSASLNRIASAADKEVAQLPELVAQTRQTLEEVQAILKDMQKTTRRMPETFAAVDETVQSLPGLVMQTQETLRQIQRLVEAGQRNWFFRGTMDQPGDSQGGGGGHGGRIRPDDVAGGGE